MRWTPKLYGTLLGSYTPTQTASPNCFATTFQIFTTISPYHIYLPRKASVTVVVYISHAVEWPRCQQQPYSLLTPWLPERRCWKPWNFTSYLKAHGPDGLPYEYYNTFLITLLPYTTRLFNGFMHKSEIPRDMQTSHLTRIPKPGKDHTLCGNYRPIALLNTDLKNFTKLLSLCLK